MNPPYINLNPPASENLNPLEEKSKSIWLTDYSIMGENWLSPFWA